MAHQTSNYVIYSKLGQKFIAIFDVKRASGQKNG